MIQHYKLVLSTIEERVESILLRQVKDEKSFDFGGVNSYPEDFTDPLASLAQFYTLVPVYLNCDSKYYKNKKILESIVLILDYLDRVQRPDGTFDGRTTNFFSAPDAGFGMHVLVWSYKLIVRYGDEKDREILEKRFFDLIKSTAKGIAEGGFHTPNHRWVQASGLMQAYNIVKDEKFKDMALKYLAEGIDCDENGEYSERSAAVYNSTNNTSMIIFHEETGEDYFLDYVKRNLDMMATYYEPDGSIFTANSRRQDRDKGQKYFPACYYHIYLFMAYKFKDAKYNAMLGRIFSICNKNKCNGPDCLYLYMLIPELKSLEFNENSILETYEKHYEKSGIVRIGRPGYTCSLIRGRTSFLFFQAGKIRCYMKICASFFAVAQFAPEEIKHEDEGYTMTFKTYGYYKMPFDVVPEVEDYWQMDYNSRPIAKQLELNIKVHVKEIDNGISVRVITDGCDRVPIKVEMCITPECLIKTQCSRFVGDAGRNVTISSGNVEVWKDNDRIEIGPGFANHMFTYNMRGSEAPESKDFTVYFTDSTNIDRTFFIKKM